MWQLLMLELRRQTSSLLALSSFNVIVMDMS